MSFIGNLSNFDYKTGEWSIFKARLTQFGKANSVKDENKSAILISHLTDESYRLVRNLAYPKKVDELTYEELVTLLDDHFKQKQCSYGDKARFYGATRDSGESLGEWAARLRGLASFCEFGNALETNLTDRFVLGLGSGPERDKLFELNASAVKLEEALRVAEAAESARDAKAVVTTTATTIKEEPLYRASSEGGGARAGGSGARRAGGGGGQAAATGRHQQPEWQQDSRCLVCGMKSHGAERCRYKGYRCQKCGQVGHLKKVCKLARINNIDNVSVDRVDEPEGTCCEECHNFNLRYVSVKPIEIKLKLGKKNVSMELDSGSGTCVIAHILYLDKFSEYPLKPSNLRMCLYNGHKIAPLGYFTIEATYYNQTKLINIFVVKNGGPPLLGRDFMSIFNLTLTTSLNSLSDDSEVHHLLEQYTALWRDELGLFNKFKVTLQLKDNSTPKFFKPRTVPFALKNKVEEELDRLVELGILIPVNYSQYATPIVPVLKEYGKVRIAGDFSVTLNKDLVIDKYPLPRIEEVFARIGGGERYSKIDLKNAYNQFQLCESSQELTTINTSKGLFKYTRLVYGLANAPAIFQKSMETLLSGIDGVSCWLDDICITGPNKATHLKRLREVLSRLSEAGLRLQKEKCEFFKLSVTYLGYVINKDGLHTCPEKVKAIINAPEPTNVAEVKRFLGVVNYYRNFIPNASDMMGPLHELMRAGAEWQWGPRQRTAVRRVCLELASERTLAHFDPAAQLVLGVDAGPAGLGAVLSVRDAAGTERPLAYGSRSLMASERNYSQIQKEATAIIFGVKRFHQYLYGRSEPFILKTDHRPLVSIFDNKSGISVTTALRLQRYAIILSAYNYIVQYTPCERNIVADYFSRAPLTETLCNSDKEFDTFSSLKFVDCLLPAVTSKDISQATENDPVCKTVVKYMNNGWPRKITCQVVKPYYQCKTDLQYEKGILLRGHRVVIPTSLRDRMLRELHSSHLGIVKMKSNARSRMWWPGIDECIERASGACDTCAALRAAPPREPPAPWPRSPASWYRIHIDYMTIGQRVYLVVIDSYSKWLECLYMNDTSTQSLIAKLKFLFSTFGIPNIIVSDNDVKINCNAFNLFCSNNGVKYMNSPIYHPNSNGQAENSVKMCKKMLKCVFKDHVKQDLIHDKLLGYLFEYRNAVHCTTGETPAKLMFGRSLRTRLDLIIPPKRSIVVETPTYRRKFEIGDVVLARSYSARKETWEQGIVKEKIGNKMFKIFMYKNDSYCIRHTDQLLKRKDNLLSDDTTGSVSVVQGSQTPPSPVLPHVASASSSASNAAEEEDSGARAEVEEWADCDGEDSERGTRISAEPELREPTQRAQAAELVAPVAPGPAEPQPPAAADSPRRHMLRPRAKVDYKIR